MSEAEKEAVEVGEKKVVDGIDIESSVKAEVLLSYRINPDGTEERYRHPNYRQDVFGR